VRGSIGRPNRGLRVGANVKSCACDCSRALAICATMRGGVLGVALRGRASQAGGSSIAEKRRSPKTGREREDEEKHAGPHPNRHETGHEDASFMTHARPRRSPSRSGSRASLLPSRGRRPGQRSCQPSCNTRFGSGAKIDGEIAAEKRRHFPGVTPSR